MCKDLIGLELTKLQNGKKGKIVNYKKDKYCIEICYEDGTSENKVKSDEKAFLLYINGFKEVDAENKSDEYVLLEKYANNVKTNQPKGKKETTGEKSLSIEERINENTNFKYIKLDKEWTNDDLISDLNIDRTKRVFQRGIVFNDREIVLFSALKYNKKEFSYHDRFEKEYCIFSGEGIEGDQELKRGNAAIANTKENGKKIILFVVINYGNVTKYYYQGVFECVDYYWEEEKDSNGNTRKELKFKLKRISD